MGRALKRPGHSPQVQAARRSGQPEEAALGAARSGPAAGAGGATVRGSAAGAVAQKATDRELHETVPPDTLAEQDAAVTEARRRAQGLEAGGPDQGPVMSDRMRGYFEDLRDHVERAYAVARAARGQGKDPVLEVEILPAEDLAARVEAQVQVPGVAADIREVTREVGNRELVALEIARRVASGRYVRFTSREQAVDKAVRTGLSILTEGVLVAPLEGIAEVKIGKNADGSDYVDLYFAGPIRAAGGTAQAMSVLIADVVRREAGISAFQVTPEEVERYKEEVPAYRQTANLQYTPGPEEIDLIVRNCPVCLNGEGTERVEVTGNRDLPRVPTNQLRGGAMLVLCEGMCLKAPKIQKHVRNLGLKGWGFLDMLQKRHEEKEREEKEARSRRIGAAGGGDEAGDAGGDGEEDDVPVIEPASKYVRDLIAGRPVFSHPSRPGGFRLRYGRARTAGLAATALHPAVMTLLDDFLAIGTQLKTERPGKGTIATPCASLDPPVVLLRNGDVVPLGSPREVQEAKPFIQEILDLGELLVPFGEFAENNHLLVHSPWVVEWFAKRLAAQADDSWPSDLPAPAEVARMEAQGRLDARSAHAVAERTGVPLAPSCTLPWHDLDPDELAQVSRLLASRLDAVSFGAPATRASSEDVPGPPLPDEVLALPDDRAVKSVLERLLVPHRRTQDALEVTSRGYALLRGLGLDRDGDRVVLSPRAVLVASSVPGDLPRRFPAVELASRLAGVPIMPRHPVRVGARMGRPEKAAHRKMKPPPHGLFPLSKAAGMQRLFQDAALKGRIRVETGKRECVACSELTYRTFCACGGHTEPAGDPEEVEIDLRGEMRRAVQSLGVSRAPPKLKGVTGLMSRHKTPEPVEKAVLRALFGITTFKDGTARFDMTDAPLTHFRPKEVQTSIRRLRELGYERDVHGEPLERDDQLLELFVQDVVLPETCGDFLVSCARFVDDLLTRFYKMEPFYSAEHRSDMVGHLVGGLAPHTSGAIAARVIGFTPSQMGWAHPYFHAGKRRNCMHPESEVLAWDPTGPLRTGLQSLYDGVPGLETAADHAGTRAKRVDDLRVLSVDPRTGTPEPKRVKRVLKVPAPDVLLKITTRSGRSITCSPDHRVVVADDGGLTKKRARDVEEGDVFVFAREMALTVGTPPAGMAAGKAGTGRLDEALGHLLADPVDHCTFVESDTEWLYDLEVEEHHNYLVNDLTLTSNCDGDEDAVFLLMDGLLNFSKHYVPDRRGGLMDLPLVLTTRLDPSEIDKEAHNLDVLAEYPLSFYEATRRHAQPREVEEEMGLVALRVGSPEQYEGFAFTHDTPDVSQGVLVSAYKTIPDMMAKLEAQFELADRIRAVDLKDVASRVIGGHFMPDLVGNLKAFSKQKVRCPLCNTKYRRMPVMGRCMTPECKGRLTLTVHEGSVRKYLMPALEISRKYEVPSYTLQRIVLAQKSIESLFNNDKVRKAKLTDFLEAA